MFIGCLTINDTTEKKNSLLTALFIVTGHQVIIGKSSNKNKSNFSLLSVTVDDWVTLHYEHSTAHYLKESGMTVMQLTAYVRVNYLAVLSCKIKIGGKIVS